MNVGFFEEENSSSDGTIGQTWLSGPRYEESTFLSHFQPLGTKSVNWELFLAFKMKNINPGKDCSEFQ